MIGKQLLACQALLGILLINTGGHPATLTWVNIEHTLVGADHLSALARVDTAGANGRGRFE